MVRNSGGQTGLLLALAVPTAQHRRCHANQGREALHAYIYKVFWLVYGQPGFLSGSIPVCQTRSGARPSKKRNLLAPDFSSINHPRYPINPCPRPNSSHTSDACWRTSQSQFHTVTSIRPAAPSLLLLTTSRNMKTKPTQ